MWRLKNEWKLKKTKLRLDNGPCYIHFKVNIVIFIKATRTV